MLLRVFGEPRLLRKGEGRTRTPAGRYAGPFRPHSGCAPRSAPAQPPRPRQRAADRGGRPYPYPSRPGETPARPPTRDVMRRNAQQQPFCRGRSAVFSRGRERRVPLSRALPLPPVFPCRSRTSWPAPPAPVLPREALDEQCGKRLPSDCRCRLCPARAAQSRAQRCAVRRGPRPRAPKCGGAAPCTFCSVCALSAGQWRPRATSRESDGRLARVVRESCVTRCGAFCAVLCAALFPRTLDIHIYRMAWSIVPDCWHIRSLFCIDMYTAIALCIYCVYEHIHIHYTRL